MNKSHSSIFLIALMVSSLVLFGAVHFGTAQSGTPSVTFQLYDTNGNPISQAIFQSVAPGTSSTLTVTMRSNDSATVYPSWNATNLPSGDTISGYWNGPEVWNINTGRMWNTWDTVTLQWTLSVPANNGYATNVVVNVWVDGSTPSPTPTASLAPTATPTLTATPTPTPNPMFVPFQLYDANGNPISQVTFQNVAPGSSSTITCYMSSTDYVTVYPLWLVTNLPKGDTITGYWNGPEIWNENTGRMWNTWDKVSLSWTLSVPENNIIANNVIVNVLVNDLGPLSSITPAPTTLKTGTPSPTPLTSVITQPILGVKTGDWIEYNLTDFNPQPNTVSPSLTKEEVTAISGTRVTLSETEWYSDGDIKHNVHNFDLSNPDDSQNPDTFVFPAEMKTGNIFGINPYFEMTSESEGFFCGQYRAVLSCSPTGSQDDSAVLTFDQNTGVLLQVKSSQTIITAVQTNMWGSQAVTNATNLPSALEIVILMIVVALVVVSLILLFLRARKKLVAS